MIKICHTCHNHSRYDTRVFWKECVSLAKNKNYDVYFIVADGQGDETNSNVNIIDTGIVKNATNTYQRIDSLVAKIKEINPQIVHFHHPGLLKTFLKRELRKSFTIIYDAHEDSPQHYWGDTKDTGLRKLFRYNVSKFKEYLASKLFDYIITVTNPLLKRYKRMTKNAEVVFNYPIVEELVNDVNWSDKKGQLCYVGGLAHRRGIHNMIEAASIVNQPISIAGGFFNKDYEKELKSMEGWKNVDFRGFLNREGVSNVYKESKIGLLNLLWTQNHANSQPIKMYEYMLAGIPFIYSKFPEWEKIVGNIGCGIAVDPDSIDEIVKGITYLLENEKIANKMGKKGKEAALLNHNWSIEEKKLYAVYNKLLQDK